MDVGACGIRFAFRTFRLYVRPRVDPLRCAKNGPKVNWTIDRLVEMSAQLHSRNVIAVKIITQRYIDILAL